MLNSYYSGLSHVSNQFDVGNLIDEIIQNKENNFQVYHLIDAYRPNVHNTKRVPYYYALECAIKVGNLECVKRLFDRYLSTTPNCIEEMRSGEKSEVAYRPIFWLAGVCNTRFVPNRPDPIKYIEIMEFMENKLQIKPDHIHKTPYGNITKIEYIEKFANVKTVSDSKDLEKRDFILKYYS